VKLYSEERDRYVKGYQGQRNLPFLYNSAVKQGGDVNNLRKNRDRYPMLVQLALQIAKDYTLGASARAGIELPQALFPYATAILQTASAL
jgi:hypothetical protein